MGLNILNLVMMGGAVVALYEGVIIVTGMEPLIKPDPIHDFLISIIPTGGNGGCTLTCTAPQVLDTASCTCQNPGCTIDCVAPEVKNNITCTCGVPNTTATIAPLDQTFNVGQTMSFTLAGFASGEVVDCAYTHAGATVETKTPTVSSSGSATISFTAVAGGHITCTGRTSHRFAQASVHVLDSSGHLI